jgi:hypothetical protein
MDAANPLVASLLQGAVIAAVVTGLLGWRIESLKHALAKGLEDHKASLSRELETCKIGLALTAEKQRAKLDAYKALSAIVDRSVATVVAISLGLAKGHISEVNAELLSAVEANGKDIYAWLYDNRLLVEDSLYGNASAYADVLLNYQKALAYHHHMNKGMGPASRTRLLTELNEWSKSAHRYATTIRDQLKKLFDNALTPTQPTP